MKTNDALRTSSDFSQFSINSYGLPTPKLINLLYLSFTNVTFLLQEMIEEADRDGDHEISQEEFLRIMKKTSLY